MLERTEGMWWGAAVEAPDPGGLASFYSRLLGWPVVHEEPGTAVLGTPGGAAFIVFQEAEGYRAPTWPPEPSAPRPMMHLDFQVADLEAAVGEALALGAVESPHRPHEHVRTLFDPAGHPFCLCRDDG
jgi:catechol 2,3-dioxygenase-like lactoylglutathione lyase family enzyme